MRFCFENKFSHCFLKIRRKGREGYFDEVLLQFGSQVVLSGGVYFNLELM